MSWIWIVIIGSLLIFFLTPVTPLNKEHFSVYDGIVDTPPLPLIRNGQREEEDIHRRDVLSRIKPYIPEDVQR